MRYDHTPEACNDRRLRIVDTTIAATYVWLAEWPRFTVLDALSLQEPQHGEGNGGGWRSVVVIANA